MRNFVRDPLPLFKAFAPGSVIGPAVAEVCDSGFLNEGIQVTELQRALSARMGTERLTLLNSCTSAIELALTLSGVDSDSSVISTPMTCVATNTPIVNAGAQIVWADIDPETGCIDPADVARIMHEHETLKTNRRKVRAVVCVDWAGNVCDLDALQASCNRHGARLIQDAAHAFSARWAAHDVSAASDFTCFPSTTRITTRTGPKKICDVTTKDDVLTSSGTFKPVQATMSRLYSGAWATIKVGQTKISATIDHPVMVFRAGQTSWMPIGEIRAGDDVYVETRACMRCPSLVPFYMKVCKACYDASNRGSKKAGKISTTKKHALRKTSRLHHHRTHVSPVMERYRSEGYRVVPLIYAIPDFLAVKDGKLVAVEVESGSHVREVKARKYDRLGVDAYDAVEWHTLLDVNPWSGRHKYTIVGQFARVPVAHVKAGYVPKRPRTVFNLTLDQSDPTYVAAGILVHNCFSFQAIKHFTTGDGGALVCRDPNDHARAQRLKWFGLDRDSVKDSRGEWRGQQWDADIIEAGRKLNMNNIDAVIGLANLRSIDWILLRHRTNAKAYDDAFAGSTAVRPLKLTGGTRQVSSHWVYTVRVAREKRDDLLKQLNARGVKAGVVHVPNHDYSCFARFKRPLPGVEEFAATQLSLPCGWWMEPEDATAVARIVEEVLSC